jgi:hypothetical protein
MSVKTSLSPALSGSSKLYSPITSPARQDLPARRQLQRFSPGSPEPMTIGRYGISRTSGMCVAAEVSRIATGISARTTSSTVDTSTPAFRATASPGSR